MNIVYGENAQGKTNFLEAIYVLSTLRSFRTLHNEEMVRFGEAEALLQGGVESELANHRLAVSLNGKARHMAVDGKKAGPVQYLGILDVFLFSYPLLEVIRGGPEERRRFLDRAVSISEKAYLPLLIRYHGALKQKMALLFRLQRGELGRREGWNALAAFNEQMLESGMQVIRKRIEYLEQLQQLLDRQKRLFFDPGLSLEMRLESSFLASEEEVRRKMEEKMEREIARGHCLIGVHRDEIRMSINGKELRKFGSSGQHRAFLLLLILAQLQLYEQWREQRPVLLLDDLDSELDQRKIRAFLDEIDGNYQTVISSSRPELFHKSEGNRFYEIKSGSLLELS